MAARTKSICLPIDQEKLLEAMTDWLDGTALKAWLFLRANAIERGPRKGQVKASLSDIARGIKKTPQGAAKVARVLIKHDWLRHLSGGGRGGAETTWLIPDLKAMSDFDRLGRERKKQADSGADSEGSGLTSGINSSSHRKSNTGEPGMNSSSEQVSTPVQSVSTPVDTGMNPSSVGMNSSSYPMSMGRAGAPGTKTTRTSLGRHETSHAGAATVPSSETQKATKADCLGLIARMPDRVRQVVERALPAFQVATGPRFAWNVRTFSILRQWTQLPPDQVIAGIEYFLEPRWRAKDQPDVSDAELGKGIGMAHFWVKNPDRQRRRQQPATVAPPAPTPARQPCRCKSKTVHDLDRKTGRLFCTACEGFIAEGAPARGNAA